MLTVMTVVGTRPELIRLSRVIPALDAVTHHVLVHTGQNHDDLLNGVFFRDLGIRPPDHALGVNTSSLGRVLGETLIGTEQVLDTEKPDAMLVLGDTNSCIAALMAKRRHIPVYRMEPGTDASTTTFPRRSTDASSIISPTSTWCTPSTPVGICWRGHPPPSDHADRVADVRSTRREPRSNRCLRRTGKTGPRGQGLLRGQRTSRGERRLSCATWTAARVPRRRARPLGNADRRVHPSANPSPP